MSGPLTVQVIIISSVVNIAILGSQDQSAASRMLMKGDLTRSSQEAPSLCFACRHSCCYFTKCSHSECPVCHLKVPLCQANCPCNIFTSDKEVEAPWEEREEEEEDGEERSVQHCGPPHCNIICARHEFCANTGRPELCQSVQCINFNV